MERTRRWYFRLLGVTVLFAVGSFWAQLPGLVGKNGIVSAGEFVEQVRRAPGLSPLQVPTWAWLSSSDAMLQLLCALCFVAALGLLTNRALRPALVVLWSCWLSLVAICHPWLSFQWDLLLVEVAFVSFFFAPPGWFLPRASEPTTAARVLLIWVGATLTLESGLVKLASGDPSWRDLTALTYHWWTQPLPTWTSVVLNELPRWVQQALCAVMFVLEVPMPLMAFGPRRARLISAGASAALQLGLAASGNFSYFNLLTLVLAVPLLDDAVFRGPLVAPRPSTRLQLAGVGLFIALTTAVFAQRLMALPTAVESVLGTLRPFGTVNAYGAFAVMTKHRAEIVLEGTLDHQTWERYEFPSKPGAVERRPAFVAPFQPRLDWQMWFAALATCDQAPWVLSLQRQLLRDSPSVRALFARLPFHGARPVALRTIVFEYRFAPLATPGTWWVATEVGPYCPPVRLDVNEQLTRD
jgi:lipase maturation factor 1